MTESWAKWQFRGVTEPNCSGHAQDQDLKLFDCLCTAGHGTSLSHSRHEIRHHKNSRVIRGFTGCWITLAKLYTAALSAKINRVSLEEEIITVIYSNLLKCSAVYLSNIIWSLRLKAIYFTVMPLWCNNLPQDLCLWCCRRERSQKPQQTQPRGLHFCHISSGERRCALHLGGPPGRGRVSRGE